jgi:voltage-dependent potassium channel beta subunit
MQYRNVGNSGMKVSEISLGGWINFENKIPEDEAQQIIKTACDSGVNFYDVADIYGMGKAELWFGKLLAQFPRHTLVISSKVRGAMSDDPNDQGLSRKHIMESIDRTLRNLGTDYLDIYFCHWFDENTPLLETARAMDDLIHQGKILYWATSNWHAEGLREVHALCEQHGLYPPQVEQPVYSMLARTHLEQEIGPVIAQTGMGVTSYSPLAMGMLTGKYDEGIPEGSRFDTEPWSTERYMNDDSVAKVQHLRTIAHDLGMTRAQLALAWCLQNPLVSSVITGATKLKQIEDNVQASGRTLPDDVMQRIEGILANG